MRSVADLERYWEAHGIQPAPAIRERLIDPQTLPLRVTDYYLGLIDWHDPADPLLAQVIAVRDEERIAPEERSDPLDDVGHSPTPGIVHRYRNRALFLVTLTCAVHCRYCFRREFVGNPGGMLRPAQYAAALAYIREHPEIQEVILSGGDPLVLPDARLAAVLGDLRGIPHVRVLRIHTRVPTVLPDRLTIEFAQRARAARPLYLVVHVNHPREVTPLFQERVRRVVDHGVTVLSQSVLLRGVNDDPSVLAELFERLVDTQIKPYYLHQLDRARGTSHFDVPIPRAIAIVAAVRARVSGIALPTHVVDLPGAPSKTPIT